MAKVISIVNQKGGTGKSACTANLAVGLVQKNMKVLIVDADPQSDVSAGFGYRDCDESNETLTALMDTVMKGLLFYGNVIIPFVDRFPKNSLYKIMTTRLEETSEAG